MPDATPGTTEVAAPDVETRTRTSHGDAGGDWLCSWCLNSVASDEDRFSMGGESEFAFKNPAGVLFVILTFARTIGCRQVGEPTMEYTWFAGHAWSYCVCDRCGMHLGWFYAGKEEFAGLIRDRIVRSTLVKN